MNIITPNRFAALSELNSLDSGTIQLYSKLKDYKNTLIENINSLKTKIHGLIMSRPIDVFTNEDSDYNDILDQVDETEKSIYCDLEELYTELHQIEILEDKIDIALHIINSNKEYNHLSESEKHELAFKNVVYNEKRTKDLKNPKYYLHKPNSTPNPSTILGLSCEDRNIQDIKDRVYDNIAVYDYNDGRQLTAINSIFKPVFNNADNSAYVIYIKDNKNQKHIFVNSVGQWLFNSKEEAQKQLSDIRGVYTLDYLSWKYIKDHHEIYHKDNVNGFIQCFNDNNKNNQLVKDIISNIIKFHYNNNKIDTSVVTDLLDDKILSYYAFDIVNKCNDNVNKYFDMSSTEFSSAVNTYYKYMMGFNADDSVVNKFEVDFSNSKTMDEKFETMDNIIKAIDGFTLLNLFVFAVIKYYLYDKVYEIKEVKF